jgi:hypothetical protein
MSSFVKHGNVSPFQHEPEKRHQPKSIEEFGLLLAAALGATVSQLNAGELTLRDIYTQVHGRMRGEYIELRQKSVPHKEAVRETNRLAEKEVSFFGYQSPGWH